MSVSVERNQPLGSVDRVKTMSKTLRLPYQTFGRKGKPVMVFVAGFPDDEVSGWGEMVSKFSETNRIICLCWPGYEKNGSNALPRWGYSLKEVVEAMHETLADISTEEKIDNFTLVIHDWGSYIGLMYQNAFPERVARVVCFDVGILKKPPLKDALIILLYQWWFCTCFFFAHFLGRLCGQAMMMGFFLFVAPIVGPAPHDKVNRPILEITPWMLYPYWHFHFGRMGYLRMGPKKDAPASLSCGRLQDPLHVRHEEELHVPWPRVHRSDRQG